MNVLYSVNNYPIGEGEMKKAVALLEGLGIDIDRYEYGKSTIMQKYPNHGTKHWDWWRVEIHTESDISVDDGYKLWEENIFDGSGSLTFVSNGELVWRES